MTTGILNTLSLEEVNAAIAESRTRGEYFQHVKTFFESGELAVDFSEKYPNVDSGSLRNSVNQNCQKLRQELNGTMPEYKIVLVPNGDTKRVVLINMDSYHLQQGTKNEA